MDLSYHGRRGKDLSYAPMEANTAAHDGRSGDQNDGSALILWQSAFPFSRDMDLTPIHGNVAGNLQTMFQLSKEC